MMHPPFDHLSKGPVSNQAMRRSHPHHCAQVAIFDGGINICTDAKSTSRQVPKKEWHGCNPRPCHSLLWAVLQTEVPPPLHSVGVTGGISRSGRRQPFADKTVGAITPRHLELD
jgi:hypothetical protein